ncbi:MAG TPA: branched-chain amino acid ABC transporter permease [Ramlibacter sp.]|uniref:branched-chain amino acid ABC transporter permease n=1 Tax=Ramlibacter sp. TaxID=1917967 RepID=UPI002BB5FD51|nr:branched-chain amino acid ABC transporter permease [Ramlibacter sp.]HVZ44915.1 branched-chain amino acid ABC transporter permease [Ramlibacter sp.]
MGSFIFEQIVNGIITGSTYALIAAGMTMIFGVLRAINFAHGEYYMLGTFAAWLVIERLDAPYAVAIVGGVAVAALIAAVIGRLVMQRLIGAPFQAGVLATLGVSLILQNAVILAFGGGYKVFNGGWIEPVQVFGVGMAQQRIVLIVVAVAVFAALEWMVRATRMGKSIRAVSQNIECCHVNGIDVEAVVRRTFLIGTMLAALSGILTAPVNVSVYGGMGESITLKTFAVIVMGGMGNVRGTLLAGCLLGVVESLVSGLIGLQYRDSVAFVALLAMLMLRPNGLFSLKSRF